MGANVRTIAATVLLLQVFGSTLAWGGGDKIKLRDIEVITLKMQTMTTGRRSNPVPQLACVGGSARCEFLPKVVQCYNRGYDGYEVQWECKADMDNTYRFGDINVSCEGYDYTEDPYVLKGSCGLEYTIDLTKEGKEQKKYAEDQQYGGGGDYGWNSNLYKNSNKKSNWITNLACGAMLVLVVYTIYKTCIVPTNETRQRSTTNDDYDRRGPGSAPPPPGFRSDYGSRGSDSSYFDSRSGDSCNANRRPNTTGTGGFSRNAGGFWTGAAAGGLLGYMFGSRGNEAPHGAGTTYRPRPSNSGFTSGFSSDGSGWSGSSGSRSSSGFGGTSRR